jgi:hypothetical protein
VLALFDVFLADVELHVWTAHLYSTALKTYEDMKRRIERNRDYARGCEFREGNGEQSIIVDGERVLEFHARSGEGWPWVPRGRSASPSMSGCSGGRGSGGAGADDGDPRDAQIRYASSAGVPGVGRRCGTSRKRGRAGTDPRLAYVELGANARVDCADGWRAWTRSSRHPVTPAAR